jgi:hypothetical protein
MRRATLLFSVALATVVAGTAVAASSSNSVNVLKVFRTQIASIKKTSTVPVILPASLPFAGKVPKTYAVGRGTKSSWVLVLARAPNCGGANACFLASFDALRGAKLPGKANLRLAGGQPAFFKDVTCGASCSPATLWFVYHGVLYTWQHKDPPKNARAVLAKLAAQAIKAGPR